MMWMQGSKPPKKGSGGLLHLANTSARVERIGEGSADDDVDARQQASEKRFGRALSSCKLKC